MDHVCRVDTKTKAVSRKEALLSEVKQAYGPCGLCSQEHVGFEYDKME